MNKNKIKSFSRNARNKLIAQVKGKLEYVLNLDSSEIKNKEKQVQQLRDEINQISQEEVIEKVAYTWFNRLIALRFMDANNYHTLNMKILSALEGHSLPEILQETKRGNIDDKLNVDRDKINDLIDGKIDSKDAQSEIYQMILVAVCNYYHKVMPFMFEKIEDYTELLLPDNLLTEDSIVKDILDNIDDEDCQDVEIIGWLYQYYISEKKDKVISAKKKYTNQEIPSATQLFTPKWIVKYMVENTLGQLWLEARPNSKIKEYMEFYIEPSDKDKIPAREIKSPEEIKIFDPACGSGHILVYAFDLLTKIYEEEGYDSNEIPFLILQNNLYGIDIDERASELANFALVMKAQYYYKRFLKKAITPNILTFEDSDEIEKFRNASVLGSLIRVNEEEVKNIKVEEGTLFAGLQINEKKQAEFLAQKYDCLITNPPYMNSKYMNNVLTDFISKEYKEVKADLFSAFIVRTLEMLKSTGSLGCVTPYVWMFIQSYEDLRKYLIDNKSIISLIRPSYTSFFESAIVPLCTFVLKNEHSNYQGKYFDLGYLGSGDEQPIRLKSAMELGIDNKMSFIAHQKSFNQIPGSPIAYWVSSKIMSNFSENKKIGDFCNLRLGMATCNNDRFLKLWYEVNFNTIGFNITNREDARLSLKKWFPYNKGGEFRKWYGNNEYLVNWENDGFEIRNFTDYKGKIRSHNFNLEYIFKPGITWTFVSSSTFGVRLFPEGFLFDSIGSALFSDEKITNYILGYLCTKITFNNLQIVNPTLSFQVGNIASLPLIFPKNNEIKEKIDILSQECINISKEDWDSKETSWNFTKNMLLNYKISSLSELYKKYSDYWKEKFYQLHIDEEELNCLFIEIYELQDELTPDVELKDITILREETKINENNQLEFEKDKVIKQFISYAVGCIFGRYSLDKEGLILANQGENLQDFLEKIGKDLINNLPTFTPNENNVIPVLDEEYFTSDIVSQFKTFLKASFGEETYQKNLDFIEEAIGKDIRNYFLKDFYDEHIRRYKKRPIYWLFSSEKGAFSALIYMHRYKNDTASIVLNDYLREYISKLQAKRESLKLISLSESSSHADKKNSDKEIGNIDKKLKELDAYEQKLLHIANQKIDIDLDDGVKVNYTKFKDVLYKIKGLDSEE